MKLKSRATIIGLVICLSISCFLFLSRGGTQLGIKLLSSTNILNTNFSTFEVTNRTTKRLEASFWKAEKLDEDGYWQDTRYPVSENGEPTLEPHQAVVMRFRREVLESQTWRLHAYYFQEPSRFLLWRIRVYKLIYAKSPTISSYVAPERFPKEAYGPAVQIKMP